MPIFSPLSIEQRGGSVVCLDASSKEFGKRVSAASQSGSRPNQLPNVELYPRNSARQAAPTCWPMQIYLGGKIVKTKNIVLAEADYMRLRHLIESSRRLGQRDAEHLDGLEQELERAIVVGETPSDVVTMNSRVRVRDMNSGREVTYEIVFPPHADVAKNRISVLAPIGTGLLGYSIGTTVEWQVPSGIRRFRILAVDQPQAVSAAA